MSFGSQPDYEGAADREGQYNLAALDKQTTANRPNLNTPWGSMNWTNEGGNWTGNVTLAPAQQQALDQQMALQGRRSELAGSLMGQVGANFQKPLDLSGLPAAPDVSGTRDQAIGAAYGQMKSRLDPMWAQREQAFKSNALAEGGDPRSAPYQSGLLNMGRDRNDAYQTAFNNAIITGGNQAAQQFDMGMKSRQQALAELLQGRSQPFNEMQALMGGQQVGLPTFPGFATAGLAQTPNWLQAAGMQGQQYQQNQQAWADAMNGGMNFLGNAMAFGYG
jgi:hypothetical protein